MALVAQEKIKRFILIACVVLAACALCACGKDTRTEKELREQAIGFMQQGDYSAAVARFNEALTYSDGKYGKLEIDILKYRAEAEVLSGDYEAATETYELLRREDGDKAEYMNLQVICMVRAGKNLSKCLELYKQSTAKEPNGVGNRQALYVLGTALARSEDEKHVQEARELYEKALSAEESATGEIYNRMGSLAFESGEIDEAIDWFQKGIEYVQDHPEEGESDVLKTLKYNIAICYEYKQEYETAKELFEEYADQYGSNDVIEHEIEFLESRIRDNE